MSGTTDPLGDMLTRIRNGLMRNKSKVSSPSSKLRANVCEVLKSEGYIRDYSTAQFDDGKSEIVIELKYYEEKPVIREISRVSRPGLRVYSSNILSTPKGVMADHEARSQNVGGEILCRVF